MSPTYDIAVIGSGIAGLTAAGEAARAGRSVVNISDSALWGGLVANVGALEGFPARARQAETISGIDLALALYGANAALGVEAVTQAITGIERQRDGGFRIQGIEDSWQARAIIVATGARLKVLDVPGATELTGKGVSQCAWCDGGLYRNDTVVVVGGGDAAFEEALHLAKLGADVSLVTHGDRPRARPAYVAAATQHPGIRVLPSRRVTSIVGTTGVEGVRLRETLGPNTLELACRAVFVMIGLTPASEFLGALVERDAAGAVRTTAEFATATPGLSAVGAVRSGYRGRLTDAVAEATAVARSLAADLEG